MRIRHMAPGDDKLSVSRIYEESWRAAYRGILPQDYLDSIPAGRWVPYLEQARRHVLLLEAGPCLAGVASCAASRDPSLPEHGELVSLYLLPAYQGRGYGRLLLEAALAELRALGHQEVFLWVLEENHPARRFYERAGFTAAARWQEDIIGGRPVRELQYRLRLP